MKEGTLKVIYSLMTTYWKFIRKYADMDSTNGDPKRWDEFTEEANVMGEMYKENQALSEFNRRMILSCIALIEASARGQLGEV